MPGLGLDAWVWAQYLAIGYVGLGHSTHQNMKELDLGADSVGELLAHPFGTPGLCKELGQ